MKIGKYLLVLVLLFSCVGASKEVKFLESDKSKIVYEIDVLGKSFLDDFEVKNYQFKKEINDETDEIAYRYEVELFKDGKLSISYSTASYYYPDYAEEDTMSSYFTGYMLGHEYGESTSHTITYERDSEFMLPFKEFKVDKVWYKKEKDFGYNFYILDKNKIIFVSIITNLKFEIDKELFFNKVSKM